MLYHFEAYKNPYNKGASMTQKTKVKKFWLALLVAMLILAALPSPALASEDLVQFTVENHADRSLSIRLYSQDGTGIYYMALEPLTTKTMTPMRGIYDYRLSTCGLTVTGTVDLTKFTTWIMPNCGATSGTPKAENTLNLGRTVLKLVKVTLINDTQRSMLLSLSGPTFYIFTIPADGSKVVTILKGFYTWSHSACGFFDTGNLYAWPGKVRLFDCN